MTRETFFWMPLMGTGLAVSTQVLNEAQAMTNHGQSLKRLAERGGLSPCEALAIAEMRAWKSFKNQAVAIEALNAIVAKDKP